MRVLALHLLTAILWDRSGNFANATENLLNGI